MRACNSSRSWGVSGACGAVSGAASCGARGAAELAHSADHAAGATHSAMARAAWIGRFMTPYPKTISAPNRGDSLSGFPGLLSSPPRYQKSSGADPVSFRYRKELEQRWAEELSRASQELFSAETEQTRKQPQTQADWPRLAWDCPPSWVFRLRPRRCARAKRPVASVPACPR